MNSRGSWFKRVFGFTEAGPATVKKNIQLDGNKMLCPDGRVYETGEFSTPSLGELRKSLFENVPSSTENSLRITHIAVQDIHRTHHEPEYKGATFQVASQFNCLEFVSPGVRPEAGITQYIADRTQGPACSLACPAATLYRNYFVLTPKGNQGQTQDDQINNLQGLEDLVENDKNDFWRTKGGYTNSSKSCLQQFETFCNENFKGRRDEMLQAIRIGVHLDVEAVRIHEDQQIVHKVNQTFCSGISISYSKAGLNDWKLLARMVLDATYECTLIATLLAVAQQKGTNIVVLTFIGGGVFGNHMNWIASSIGRACALLNHYDLEVQVAHYRSVNESTKQLINQRFEEFSQKLKEKPEMNPYAKAE